MKGNSEITFKIEMEEPKQIACPVCGGKCEKSRIALGSWSPLVSGFLSPSFYFCILISFLTLHYWALKLFSYSHFTITFQKKWLYLTWLKAVPSFVPWKPCPLLLTVPVSYSKGISPSLCVLKGILVFLQNGVVVA